MIKWSILTLTIAVVGGAFFVLNDVARAAKACDMPKASFESLVKENGEFTAVAHARCLVSGAQQLQRKLEARAER